MIDDDNAIEIPFEPLDAYIVWEHYLETCRRAAAPVSREQADKLIKEWSEAIEAGLARPAQH